jgi:hypothetical protein
VEREWGCALARFTCYSTSTIQKRGLVVTRGSPHVCGGPLVMGTKEAQTKGEGGSDAQSISLYLNLRVVIFLSLSHASAPLPPSSLLRCHCDDAPQSLLRCASSSPIIPDLRGGSEGSSHLRVLTSDVVRITHQKGHWMPGPPQTEERSEDITLTW